MSEKAKCPNCEALIDHLDVSEDGHDYRTEYVTRYGTASLDGEDIDIDYDQTSYNDSETTDEETDERHFKCPECENEISPDELEIIDEKNAKKSKNKPNPIRTQEAARQELIRQDLYRFHREDLLFLVCSCGTKVEVHQEYKNNPLDNHEEKEIECTKCGKIITAITAKEIIKI